MGEALGFGVVLLKAGGCGQGVCLNRRNNAGPETDSLDHRTGADTCHVAFYTMNFIVPSACTHSWFPPLRFEHTLHLVNQGLHHSEAKTDVLHSLINSHLGPETQWLNMVGS